MQATLEQMIEELKALREKDPEAWDRLFTRIWTRKESFLKYLGTGLMTPADQVCVLPGRQGEVSFAETEVEGHLMCVCHPGRARVNFARWDLDLQR